MSQQLPDQQVKVLKRVIVALVFIVVALIALTVTRLVGDVGGGPGGEKAQAADPTSATPTPSPSTWTRARCGQANEIEWMDHNCDEVMAPKTYEHDVTKGEVIEYDGGVTVRFVKAEIRPASQSGNEISPGQKVVRVVVQFSNTGEEPQPMPDAGMQGMTLLYGIDLIAAEPDPGYFEGDLQTDNLPRQISPGRKVEYVESFDVPTKELKHVTVECSFYNDIAGDVHQFTNIRPVK